MVRRGPRGNNYLALETDIRGFGTESGWLGYSASGRTLLGVGGLHGSHPESLLRSWVKAGKKQGFRNFLLFPVYPEERATLASSGFASLLVGTEALIRLDTFSLEGPSRRNLRQTVARATREPGLQFSEVSRANRFIFESVFETWLSHRLRPERMGRLVGQPGFEHPLHRRFFGAFIASKPVAFVTLTPGWNGKGWGMDTMARKPEAPPGVMEWLIVRIMESVANEGAVHFSLGACPLRLPNDHSYPLGPFFRALFHLLYRHPLGERLFPFRGLARFKEKFDPVWVPVLFGAYSSVSMWSLYEGCRMWGLFGHFSADTLGWPAPPCAEKHAGLETSPRSVIQPEHSKRSEEV